MSDSKAKTLLTNFLSSNTIESHSDGEIRSYLQEITGAPFIYVNRSLHQNAEHLISMWKRSDGTYRLMITRRRLYTSDLTFEYDQKFEHFKSLKLFCNQQDFGALTSYVIAQLNLLTSDVGITG